MSGNSPQPLRGIHVGQLFLGRLGQNKPLRMEPNDNRPPLVSLKGGQLGEKLAGKQTGIAPPSVVSRPDNAAWVLPPPRDHPLHALARQKGLVADQIKNAVAIA